MFKAINLTKTTEYTSYLDPNKDTDDAVVFTLGAVDTRTMSSIIDKNIENKTTKEGEMIFKPNQMTTSYLLVRFGLKGLKNWKNYDDSVIEFKTETVNMFGRTYKLVSEDIISAFPSELITELAGEIYNLNNLTDEDLKN